MIMNFDRRRVTDPIAAIRSSEIARFAVSAIFALFLMTTLMIPAALVNKIIFVMLLAMLLIAPVASHGRVKIRSMSPLIVLGIFLYGYTLAFVGATDPVLTNQLMLSVSVLMLIYVIDWYAIDLDDLIKLSGLAFCSFTAFAIYAIVIAPSSALGLFFADYFLKYSLGASGERSFSETALFNFRIGPVTFLFLPFCLFFISFLNKRRIRDFLALILISAVSVVSTSRALVLGCLLAMVYLVVSRMRPSRQVITLCVSAGLGIFLAAYVMAQTTIFSPDEYSNSIKVGHAISFMEHMTPANLFFGEGLAATYFTIGLNAVTAQTEITLLDMVRYFGMPLTALLYAALLFPVSRRNSYTGENRTAVVLFLIYLLMSLTNPVLFNSYGLIVVIWYWSKILAASASNSGEPPRPEAA